MGITVEIEAKVGEPYLISRTKSGLIKLSRPTYMGGEICIIFSHDDVVAVIDAMYDFLEMN